MKRSTDGMLRRPFAAATATIKTTKPIGSSQSRLNHRLRPMRTRGAMPCAWGIDPAHVVGSTTSSPVVSCDRKLRTASGEIPDGAGAGSSSVGPVGGQTSIASWTCVSRGTLARDRSTDGRRGGRQATPSPLTSRSGRERRGEEGQQGEAGPTLVGHAQLLITPVEGKGTGPEATVPSSVSSTPSPSTAKSMRSDEPWVCGGRAWPGLSRMSRTLDCEPSRNGSATTRSLS